MHETTYLKIFLYLIYYDSGRNPKRYIFFSNFFNVYSFKIINYCIYKSLRYINFYICITNVNPFCQHIIFFNIDVLYL